MSQYTCVVIPMFDSVAGDLHSVFMGGISLNDYIDSTQQFKLDTLIPYINDITTLVRHADGTSEEIILPIKMPELGGANAEFFMNQNIPRYSNGVIKLNEVKNNTLLGYLYGGINSTSGNEGNTNGSNKAYRIFLVPDFGSSISKTESDDDFSVFPNPADGFTNIFSRKGNKEMQSITIHNYLGKEMSTIYVPKNFNNYFRISTTELPQGIYFVRIANGNNSTVMSLSIIR